MFDPTRKYSKFYPWARSLLFPGEKEGLARYSRNKEIIVEIGVFEGASACVFKKNMSTFGHLYLIDPFISDSMNENLKARKWMAHLNVACTFSKASPKIKWIETKSTEIPEYIFYFLKMIDPIDFLFLDGDHTEKGVFKDWEFYSPLVKKGGLVALHDSIDFSWFCNEAKGHDGPKKLREHILQDVNYVYEYEFGTISIFKKL
jgi:predicted O-methyltransferase YrrM